MCSVVCNKRKNIKRERGVIRFSFCKKERETDGKVLVINRPFYPLSRVENREELEENLNMYTRINDHSQ
jgi:hypothetical protein